MLDLSRGQEEGGQRLLVGMLAGCSHPTDPRARTLGGALLLAGAWAALQLGATPVLATGEKEKGCQQRIREGAASGGEDEGRRWILVKR